ncbi:MAG: ABC transporter permease subunit [Rhizobiales bacterium]|nr:ABC transporter permease subunit [Hyphomicrobiales bacterium]
MEKLIAYTPFLLKGALITFLLALASLALATFLGAIGAWGKLSRSMIANAIAWAYTTLVRGIPDLVLMLLIYYGGQRMLNQAALAAGYDGLSISPFLAGTVTIGFIFGAYLTETFRGAYMSVPKGQSEAAQSLGLHRYQTLILVTLPQLLRHALPGYGNVWLVLVKSTAIVSVIGLEDVVGIADKAAKSTREPFLFFLAVIAVFLAITAASSALLRYLERRYSPETSAIARTANADPTTTGALVASR